MRRIIFMIILLATIGGGYWGITRSAALAAVGDEYWWITRSSAPAPAATSVTGSGTIEAETVAITAELGGRILDLAVDEGNEVTAGQVLVELDKADLLAQQFQLETALATAKANLTLVSAPARAEDVAQVSDYLADKSCSLSFSSLRADIFNPSLIKLLGRSKLKTAAIAPDGGSERLRRIINKGIDENDVLTAAEILTQKGIRNLKLYYMIGLPTESQADLDEMVNLIQNVKK